MANEELKIRAPHTQEVDGEMIPNFKESPRTYTEEERLPWLRPYKDLDYLEIGKKVKRQVKANRKKRDEILRKKIDSDPLFREITRMNSILTPRELDIYYVIRSFQWTERYSPSSWELSKIFGTNGSYVRKILRKLVDKGVLEMSPHREGRKYMRRVLFPRGMWWPWHDYTQFPPCIFWDKNADKHGVNWAKASFGIFDEEE